MHASSLHKEQVKLKYFWRSSGSTQKGVASKANDDRFNELGTDDLQNQQNVKIATLPKRLDVKTLLQLTIHKLGNTIFV